MTLKILDVGIGLSFVYLLLSLVVTSFQELWAALLNKRSKVMEKGLTAMLGKLASSVYEHGLVKSLQVGKSLPSYIPSGTFSLALLDLIAPGAQTPEDVLKAVESGATPLDAKLKEALRPLINAAAADMRTLRANVESWFNAAMDRVSGAYKRNTQLRVLVISLAITGAMDVDSIRIASTLLTDDALRSATVAMVEKTVASKEFSDKVQAAAAQADADESAKDLAAARRKVDQSLSAVWELGMPIGWSEGSKLYFQKHPQISILGLLITALAVSLGAPFWFDLLSKIVAVRSTVKPQEKDRSAGDQPIDLAKT